MSSAQGNRVQCQKCLYDFTFTLNECNNSQTVVTTEYFQCFGQLCTQMKTANQKTDTLYSLASKRVG